MRQPVNVLARQLYTSIIIAIIVIMLLFATIPKRGVQIIMKIMPVTKDKDTTFV